MVQNREHAISSIMTQYIDGYMRRLVSMCQTPAVDCDFSVGAIFLEN